MSTTAIAAEAIPEQIPAPADPVAVAAAELVRRYGEGDTCVDALRGVSLDVAEGRLTAIMGQSGSGKSTLMHILAGLDRPTSGSVRIDGVEITDLPDKKLTLLRRDTIGFVFQFFTLESPDPSEPELDDEAARVKRNRERLDVDDLPRAPVEPDVPLTREKEATIQHELSACRTRSTTGAKNAAAVTHAVAKHGVAFALPVGSIVAFTVTAIVAEILAAVAPARRASRLDVLSALQHE